MKTLDGNEEAAIDYFVLQVFMNMNIIWKIYKDKET